EKYYAPVTAEIKVVDEERHPVEKATVIIKKGRAIVYQGFTDEEGKCTLIPKEYIEKYSIDNLWKYNMPKAWRLLYSVAGKQSNYYFYNNRVATSQKIREDIRILLILNNIVRLVTIKRSLAHKSVYL
ncbi:MAG: hypothetical protein QME47_07005, partial [Candidatus Thermoplasmatota archaeon]|nr:hypothetical protein [Candidatus Thermoplasmatota archaeon]